MPSSYPSKVTYQRSSAFEEPITFPPVAQYSSSSSSGAKTPSQLPNSDLRENSEDRVVTRHDSGIDVSDDIYLASLEQQQQQPSDSDDGEQTPTRGRSVSPKPVPRYVEQHTVIVRDQRRVAWADGWESPIIPASPMSETPPVSAPAPQQLRGHSIERGPISSATSYSPEDGSLVVEVFDKTTQGVLMLVKALLMIVFASALAWCLVNTVLVTLSLRTFSDAWAELGIEQMLFEELGWSLPSVSEAAPSTSDGFERLWSTLASASVGTSWGETLAGYLLVVMVFGWLKLLMTVYHSFFVPPKPKEAKGRRALSRSKSVLYGPKGFGQA